MKKFIIIDGNSLINRAYFAISRPMITRDGIYTHGIYGFLNMLDKIRKDYKPDFIGVAFDVKSPTFRHEMYKEYKSGRKKMDLELAMQLPILKDVLSAMNIKTVEMAGFEADDLIGTLAKKREDIQSLIITGDKDALQLVDETTHVVFTKKGISEFTLYDEKTFVDEYGFEPKILIDYKALFGDKSDNIPGVAGVGDVTAKKLIYAYGDLDSIYENIEDVTPKGVKSKLEDNRIEAYMSKRLATIDTNVPMDVEVDEFKVQEPDLEKLAEIYTKLEFNSFLKKLGLSNIQKKDFELAKFKKTYIKEDKDIIEFSNKLKEHSEIGIYLSDSEEEKKDKRTTALLGILLGEELFAIRKDEKTLDNVLEKIKGKKIFGHQLRDELVFFMERGFKDFDISFDTAISRYLIDSSKNDYTLKKLAEVDGVELNAKQKEEQLNFESIVDVESQSVSSELDLLEKQFGYILYLMAKDKDAILKDDLKYLFYDLELPLIEVMAFMQYLGFRVDKDRLRDVGGDFKSRIKELTEQIFEYAGKEFNINSPRQLGVVLFEDLGLTAGKKTKTGYSTNAETLEKLRKEHPIIELILEYRKLNKLVTTYVDGLINYIGEDGKIHSQFNQTITTTGRISSSNPNMQNIPIRDEKGKKIRSAFVAEDGYILVGADYSQIELRVLADMSQDESLIESFNRGEDIHRATASRVMGIPKEDITLEQRSSAKAVNFGVIYGMGAFSLSEDLNITWQEAEKYINDYFDKHQRVKSFMDEQVEFCKKHGYVQTILGRKRYIPEINGKNMIVKQQGIRLAMNSPIQGSAADIIKLAMIDVYKKLKDKKSRLILQVHDELIIETYNSEVEEILRLLKDSMENAMKLKVDLQVDIHKGTNWLELK